MSRTKFGAESAHLTKWLPAGEIAVDPAVQRSLNVAWASRIGRELDPDLMGVIHVSKRSNGRYYAIDGQHRLWGVKHVFGNNGTLVECKVYEGLTKAQEAELFVGLNNFRRPTIIDVFLKNVMAQDHDAMAIDKIVRFCGFRVDRAKGDGVITAVGALYEVYYGFADVRDPSMTDEERSKGAKPDLLRDTLSVVGEAWGGTSDSLHGHMISGIGRLLAARQRVMQVSDLTHKLSQYPGGPTALIGAASGRRSLMGGKLGMSVADVCLELYNRGRRVGKSEPLR